MTDLNIHMSGCKPTTSFVMLITKWKHRKKNIKIWKGFPGGSSCKESACNAGKASSILGSGRSPGEGKGNSLQYSCLEKPMDRGAWWAIVHAWGHKKVRHDWATLLLLYPDEIFALPSLWMEGETIGRNKWKANKHKTEKKLWGQGFFGKGSGKEKD